MATQDDGINIKITSTADPKGVKEMAKELNGLEDSADDAERALGKSGETASKTGDELGKTGTDALGLGDSMAGLKLKLEALDKAGKQTTAPSGGAGKLFPTFTKIGGAVKGLGARLVTMAGGPIGIAVAAIGVLAGVFLKHFRDIRIQAEKTAEVLSRTTEKSVADLDDYKEALEGVTSSFDPFQHETDKAQAALKRLNGEKEDAIDLAESEQKAGNAAIDLAVASGEITEEQAAGRRGSLERKTAARRRKAEGAFLTQQEGVLGREVDRSAGALRGDSDELRGLRGQLQGLTSGSRGDRAAAFATPAQIERERKTEARLSADRASFKGRIAGLDPESEEFKGQEAVLEANRASFEDAQADVTAAIEAGLAKLAAQVTAKQGEVTARNAGLQSARGALEGNLDERNRFNTTGAQLFQNQQATSQLNEQRAVLGARQSAAAPAGGGGGGAGVAGQVDPGLVSVVAQLDRTTGAGADALGKLANSLNGLAPKLEAQQAAIDALDAKVTEIDAAGANNRDAGTGRADD